MHEFDEHQQSKWRSPDCNHGDQQHQSSRLQGPEMVQSFNILFKEEPQDDHEPWGQRNTGMSPASSHGSEETTSTSGEPEQHQENHNTATTSHRCFGCGQEFPAAYDLVLHQRTHIERGFNKSVCGELFYQKELLKTHHQKVDTGEKPQRSF
ncbi:zinc finger protein 180-like isoform X2 [Salvelinus namaycush]|uniref:Zinc finger protein 180-like isoform X2 n=1 Tax=Salvelinus namaycush TaxID=8040 RepID=A0A8U0QIB0_SALNM|nr:zinc finger protein 180-like isoform X2 [Salvelinus namaycush]XP_038843822.1 zinc finger protein 180-like isoform X2 [Salvelinus namaycush]